MEHSESSTADGRVVAAIALLVVVASALHFLGGQVADPDLWQHVRFGELIWQKGFFPRADTFSYTAYGAPLVNHEWLAQVAFAAAFVAAGSAGLVACKLVFAAALLLLLLDTTRTIERDLREEPYVHPLLLAGVLVLTLSVISPGATFRPQIFTIVALAAQGALLARGDRRLRAPGAGLRAIGWEMAAQPVLIGIWANLHGGFLVGVGMLVIYAAVVVARWWRSRRAHGCVGTPTSVQSGLVALVALAGVLAPMVNPYGSGLYAFLGRTLHAHDEISEWFPVPLLSTDFLRFKLLVAATVAGAAFLWWQRRSRPAAVALLDWRVPFLAIAALYAFRHQRHTVLFAVVAAPLVVVAAEEARRAAIAWRPGLRPRRAVLVAGVAGALLIVCLQVYGYAGMIARQGLDIRYGRLDFPVDAVEFLQTHGIRGNVAMPLEWGSYAIWKLAPGSRVFIDGRFETVYPPRVIEDYFAFMNGGEGWERLLDEYPTEVVVVQRWRDIHPRLFQRPDLVYVYSDPAALVFVRRTATNAEALDRLARLPDRSALARAETVFP
jgi:hypothetical protein